MYVRVCQLYDTGPQPFLNIVASNFKIRNMGLILHISNTGTGAYNSHN